MTATAIDRVMLLRRALIAGASSAAITLTAMPAYGQRESGAAGEAGDGPIHVAGSRIRADGMQAPVPVTVVDADEIAALSPGALITGVRQLPQFYGNQTPNSANFFVRSGYGSPT